MAEKKNTAGLAPLAASPPTPDYVVAELRYDSQVGYSPAGFAGSAEAKRDVSSLNGVLEAFEVKEFGSHFDRKASDIRKRTIAIPGVMKATVEAGFAQSGFVRVVPEEWRCRGTGQETERAEVGVEGSGGAKAGAGSDGDRVKPREPQLRARARVPGVGTERRRSDGRLASEGWPRQGGQDL